MVNIGKWAFLAGVVLAVLSGFTVISGVATILLILGLIVGFLNISKEEIQSFLIAVIALLVIGVSGLQAIQSLAVSVPVWVDAVLANFLVFAVGSGIVVAIRSVISLGRDK
jgi:hypothetical protein